MNLRGEGIYSLPTEAQWEYAARAGSTWAFANGNITTYTNMTECNSDANLDAIGWYCENADSKSQPVAQKLPNAWGLYDMSGNVNEFCQDGYGSYPSGPVTDPVGPTSGLDKVIRGGDWAVDSYAHKYRSASRGEYPNYNATGILGFRLVKQP